MLIVAASLAAAIWTMPSGQSAFARSDHLPAPQVMLRWNVSSGPPAAPVAKPNVAPVCSQAAVQKTATGDSSLFWGSKDAPMAGVRKLNEEPNADAISAVLYTEGLCMKPIVVSRDVGLNPRVK